MKAEDIYDKALTEYPIKEKLNKKAVGTYDANYPRRKAFIIGAEWMQEKMIEKATQFIYDTIFGWTGGSVTKTWNQCRDEYVGRLKQAMQDESK